MPQYQRYTKAVSVSKMILLAIVAIIILLLIILPLTSPVNDVRVNWDKIEKVGSDEIPRMMRPEFEGMDEKGRPFSMVAEYAMQKSEHEFSLTNLEGEIALKDESWLSLLAKTGEYDHLKKTADLKGKVHLFFEEGYEFFTDFVHINIAEKSAYGYFPIQGQGPLGSIEARHFVAKSEINMLKFGGGVKVTLYPKQYNDVKTTKTTRGKK